MLVLGLTEHQDPHQLKRALDGKFRREQLRGISGVVLQASGSHGGPGVRHVLDLIGTIDHPKALVAPPSDIPLGPIGLALDLFEQHRPSDGLSTYRVGQVSGRVLRQSAMLGLRLPRRLTPEMLA